jgi:hypothetical protein
MSKLQLARHFVPGYYRAVPPGQRPSTHRKGALLTEFRSTTFVCIMQVDVGLDIVAVCEAIQLFFDDQTGSAVVAPTSFDDKRIPHQYLLIIREISALKAPSQKFLVCSAFQCFGCQSIVVGVPKPAEPCIKAREIGKPQIVAGWQHALGMEPDFVQHAGKENDAGCFDVVAAGGLIIHFDHH